jgi:hypothetical protein
MASNLKSVEYKTEPEENPEAPGWFKIGVLAAASALAGGLAVVWFYRSTLTRLRQAEGAPPVDSPANDEGEGI